MASTTKFVCMTTVSVILIPLGYLARKQTEKTNTIGRVEGKLLLFHRTLCSNPASVTRLLTFSCGVMLSTRQHTQFSKRFCR